MKTKFEQKATFKERLEAGLKALDYREIPGVTRKYSVWTQPETTRKLFVGKSGALRSGKCASASFSLGDPGNQTPVYKRILGGGDAALMGTGKNTATIKSANP